MELYHGSSKKLDVLKRHKPCAPPGTPEGENLDVIYFTPEKYFAILAGAAVEGVNTIDHGEKTVCFQNPEKFNPDKIAYVYVVDSSRIPEGKKIVVDPWQIAVDVDEIMPDKVETHKAGEILNYYRILDR